MNISDKEEQAVLRLGAQARYNYFIKKVVDWEVAWGLWDQGWVSVGSKLDGSEVLPLWPAERYAQICATSAFQNCSPRSISVYELIERLLPDLTRAKTSVVVFMTPLCGGIERAAELLQNELLEECKRY